MSNKFLDNTGVSDLVNSIATNIANKYATKAIATQSANGLMSAADKVKLDNITEVNKITIDSALSSTSTNPVQNKVINSALAGKAASSHSHTKSQITDFPSSLPANGGNADTVDGMHASDFMPINGEVRKYGAIYMNASDGIRARHIDGNNTEFDGALYLNWNSPNAPIYMNGGNTAIHSGNIGSQSVNYANGAGNADTVDSVHISCTNDAASGSNWFAAFTDNNNLRAIDPGRAYVGNAGNTNTIGGFADAYHLGTLDAGGNGHGSGWQLFCQHNLYGDSRFGIKVGDGSLGVRVDFATTANIAYSASTAASANNAATACYIDQVLLVGTSSSCHYNTILDWANSRKIAWASIIAGDGYPSDGPSQNEALLRVESDYYNARKIVTWTRYWGGQPAVIMQRTIFNGGWADEWKSVSG